MVDENAATTSSIIRQNIFTYFNLIFAIISLLLLIAGSFKSLTFYLLSSLTLSSELLNNCALKSIRPAECHFKIVLPSYQRW